MDFGLNLSVAAILAQDGITSGAVYALLALALVLVFSVTRVIFIPQGEFVAFGALTLAAIQADKFPLSATLLVALGALSFIQETAAVMFGRSGETGKVRQIGAALLKFVLLPLAIYAVTRWYGHATLAMPLQVLLTLLIVVPMGP
ncbi:MAG: putative amino-acid transrane transporter protein, partial [Collimonas fungivorans]|nr:putative amino-acid transrane transporter protein [Collimonas fungivorans]